MCFMKCLKLITLTVLNMFLMTTLSCGNVSNMNKTKQDDQPLRFEVSYSTIHDWVGYYLSVKIDQNGSLTVNETSLINESNTSNTYQLTNEELNEIQTLLMKLTKVNLKASYTTNTENYITTDLPTNTLRYNVDGKVVETSIYGAGGNNELSNLIGKINIISKKYYRKHL